MCTHIYMRMHLAQYISWPLFVYIHFSSITFQDSCVGCCLPNFDLGIQWPKTQHNQYAEVPCSAIHSSFTDTKVRRRCRPDDSWDPADVTSCTFKNVTMNPIFLLTTNVTLTEQQHLVDVIENIQAMIEKQVSYIHR